MRENKTKINQYIRSPVLQKRLNHREHMSFQRKQKVVLSNTGNKTLSLTDACAKSDSLRVRHLAANRNVW